MKKLCFALVLTSLIFTFNKEVKAQQDPMYSMYMFNGLSINPAYAGSRDKMSVTALYRQQWTGFKGAPNTFSLTGHAPLLNKNYALGLSITSDNISVFNNVNITASYAYRIKFKDNSRLSIGVSGSYSNYRARWGELTLNDVNDQAFTSSKNSISSPNFGAGIYYYSDKFYVGVSVPKFLNSSLSQNLKLEGTNGVAREWKHYFYTVGAIFKVSENVKFKPSLLIKQVKNAPVQADINMSVLFKEALWVGASYRTGDAVVLMIEYLFAKQFRIGYAYDMTTSELNNYSAGTHEIMLGVEFGKKDAYLTPRRMSYF